VQVRIGGDLDKYKMLNKKHRVYKKKILLQKNPPPTRDQQAGGERESTLNALFIFLKRSVLIKTLKGTKQTKDNRDEPHTEEKQVKKMRWGKGKNKELIFSAEGGPQ